MLCIWRIEGIRQSEFHMSPFTLLVVRSLEESQERSEKLLQGLKELREIFSLDVQRFSEFFKLLESISRHFNCYFWIILFKKLDRRRLVAWWVRVLFLSAESVSEA